jgi:DNA-dependent protein kinase catalytic subunit
MKNAHIETILIFFKSRIAQMINILNTKFGFDFEVELINNTGTFIIIEAFFSSVPKEKIEESTFSFDNKLNNGKALLKELLLKARDARVDPLLSNHERHKELYRKYQCYAYRALITMTVNSLDNPKIYNLTLFEELPDKNKLIWSKLINVDDENLYSSTSQDFESFPKIKEYIVSIKDLKPPEIDSKKRNYLATTSIFDHTLSQTLTKSDLTYSVVLSNQRPQKQNEEHQANMKIQMESIPINNHEVMSHLIGVVQSIHAQKISPFHEYEKHPKDKYQWAVSIANSLSDFRQHKNVKIFIAKFIENCRVIFSHYAKIFTGPILSILTDGTLGDKMNFFITDLTAMLISWSANYIPSDMQEKNDAGKLFNFLLANAYHDRSEIFKLNLELLKKLIESWRKFLEDKISFATLTDLLEQRDKLSFGLQLNAVVLSNEIAPWENKDHCQRYVDLIMKAFRSDAETKLYKASAQLLGMCLNLISKDETIAEVMKTVEAKLKQIAADRNKTEMLLEILYGKYFSKII